MKKDRCLSANELSSVNLDVIPGFFAIKDLDSKFIRCNKRLWQYVGYDNLDAIIGKDDYDFQWAKYAHIYRNHELDAIKGNYYPSLYPGIDLRGDEVLIFCSRYQRQDENGNVIGVIGHGFEIRDRSLLEVSNMLKVTGLPEQSDYYTVNKDHEISLSRREKECLFYLLRGKTVKSIAVILELSARTVERYVENMKYKFTCRNRSELISKAIELGYMRDIPGSLLSKGVLTKTLVE